MHHVILGSGVAGLSAATTLRSLQPTATITLISEDPHGFYSRPGLAYYLTDEIPEKQLQVFTKKDWQTLRLQHLSARVTAINPLSQTLQFSSSSTLAYDRLLLATGSLATPIPIPGTHLRGVVKLDDLEDARQVISLARNARTAVVIGGGIIAVELVEGLLHRRVKVHYFLRADRYWPSVLEERESRLIEDRLTRQGIHLHFHTESAEILEKRGRVTAVRTTAGQVLPCDILAVGVGVQPRTQLAQAAGISTDRGILTDEYLQTSLPGIFAAGDAAQVLNPATGLSSLNTLWHPALRQGQVAAHNMAGLTRAYHQGPAFNRLRLAGVMTTLIGAIARGHDDDILNVARGSSETWRQLPNTLAMETGSDLNLLRLMVGEHTLLGAVIMGEQKLATPLLDLITNQVDIAPLRDRLLHAGPALGDILLEFWDHWKNNRGTHETQQ